MLNKIKKGITPARIVLAVSTVVGACLVAVGVVALMPSAPVAPSVSADVSNCAVWQTTSAGGTYSTPYFRDGAVCVEWKESNPFVVPSVVAGDWEDSQGDGPFVVEDVSGGDWEDSQNSSDAVAPSTPSTPAPVAPAPVVPPVATPTPAPVAPVAPSTPAPVAPAPVVPAPAPAPVVPAPVVGSASVEVDGMGHFRCFLDGEWIATVIDVGFCSAVQNPAGIVVKPKTDGPSIGLNVQVEVRTDGTYDLFAAGFWVANVADLSLATHITKYADNHIIR